MIHTYFKNFNGGLLSTRITKTIGQSGVKTIMAINFSSKKTCQKKADELAKRLEATGHKQTYWIKENKS